jgi:hypothetical protein
MTVFNFLTSAIALSALALPASAQYSPYPNQPVYPYPAYPGQPAYPQQYPQPYPGYGYGQSYTGNPVTDIIDQLLGNRYSVTDRQAVRQCARAAMGQASAQFGGGYGGYDGYNQGYGYRGRSYGAFRVTAITNVERRSYGLRVSGLLSSGRGYGGQYGYQDRGDARGDLSFRCNVDYRGAVTNLRVRPAGYR